MLYALVIMSVLKLIRRILCPHPAPQHVDVYEETGWGDRGAAGGW